MDEARKALLDKLIKRYSFKNITKHWSMNNKNLVELTSGYPSHGLGFLVYRKTWQPETFFKVKKVELYGPRRGEMYGVKYVRGKIATGQIELIPSVLKKGIWQYKIPLDDPTHLVKEDNGVEYSVVRIEKLLKEKNDILARRYEAITKYHEERREKNKAEKQGRGAEAKKEHKDEGDSVEQPEGATEPKKEDDSKDKKKMKKRDKKKKNKKEAAKV